MNKRRLTTLFRLLCGCIAVCSLVFGHVPAAHANLFLKEILIKATALEFKLRAAHENQCEQYFVNAGKTDKEDNEALFLWLNKYEEQKCAVEEIDGKVWGWLGILYESGKGTKQNIDKAIYYYTKSAKKGDAAIQYFLGTCLIKHRKDYTNGLFWLEKAASNGNDGAQFELGTIYSDEDSPHYKLADAFKFFEMCAKLGDVDCSYSLGLMYYYGENTEIDVEKAFDLLYYAAERGEEDAAHYLSWMLLHDYEITDELLEEAYLWLEVSKHFGSRMNEDGELEKKLLKKISPSLKAKVDAKVPKFCSEIENRKEGL